MDINEVTDFLEDLSKKMRVTLANDLPKFLPSEETTGRLLKAAKDLHDCWDYYRGYQLAEKYRNGLVGMKKEQLINLGPEWKDWLLSEDEFFYLAKTLGAHWEYDYAAAESGKPGYHALLKSLRHSDQFFVSKIILEYPNIRRIIAKNLVRKYKRQIPIHLQKEEIPDWVAGIPDGATKLGEDVAEFMGAKVAVMEKIDGRITLKSEIPPGERLLLVEDFCTKGTGFKEAVADIMKKYPQTEILPRELVILNRGGLTEIETEDGKKFRIQALITRKIDDWNPDSGECKPCKYGSKAIKPKATDENWHLITTAQL